MLGCDAGKKEAIQHSTLCQGNSNLLHSIWSIRVGKRLIQRICQTMTWKTFITHMISDCSINASQKNILAVRKVPKVFSRKTK